MINEDTEANTIQQETNEESTSVSTEDMTATKPGYVSQPADMHGWWRGTGRRKRAIASVRIKSGDGQFTINKKPYNEYFTEERDHKDLMSVLEKTNTKGKIDIFVNARGGGFTGQAGAVILGLGRALLKYDGSLEHILRDNQFLTRDARQVERKKYGQAGARRRFQFSKR